MSKRHPRQTKRERKGTPHQPRAAIVAPQSDRKALFSEAFSSERAACITLIEWFKKTTAQGYSPAQLAATFNPIDPERVVVTMGTRTFWKLAISRLERPADFDWLDEPTPDMQLAGVPVVYMTALDDFTVMELWALAASSGLDLERNANV